MDLDPAMLAAARRKGPGIEWIEGDLAAMTVADGEAGPGWIVAGFQLDRPALALTAYDQMAAETGLALEYRWVHLGPPPLHRWRCYTVSAWVMRESIRGLLTCLRMSV